MVESRIPADSENLKNVEPWFVPVIGADGKVFSSHQKEMKEGKNEKIENLTAYVQNGRLSGEVLEKVYQQAHEEGVSQGQAQGYQTGHEQGFAKGQQEGSRAGLKQAQTEWVTDRQVLQQLTEQLLAPLNKQNEVVKDWLFTIVTQVCQHLAIKECEQNTPFIIDAVEKSVAALPVGADHICVTLNPQDIEILKKYTPQSTTLEGLLSEDNGIKADAQLSRGSCNVHSAYSDIDFSIESRVQKILSSLIVDETDSKVADPSSSPSIKINDENAAHH